MELEASLDTLKGSVKEQDRYLNTPGWRIGELITYYPRTYERYENAGQDIGALKKGQFPLYTRSLQGPLDTPISAGFRSRRAVVGDGSERIALTWFNMPSCVNTDRAGDAVCVPRKNQGKGTAAIHGAAAVFRPEQYEGLTGELRPILSACQRTDRKDGAESGKAGDAEKSAAARLSARQAIRNSMQLSEYNFADRADPFSRRTRRWSWQGADLYLMSFSYFLLQLRGLKYVREKAAKQLPYERSRLK